MCMSYTDRAGGKPVSARAVVALGSTTFRNPKTVTSIAAAAMETAIIVRARKEAVFDMAVSRKVDNGDYRGCEQKL